MAQREMQIDEECKETMMRTYLGIIPATLSMFALLGLSPVAQADGIGQAAAVAPCAMQLRVELTPDVPDPSDAGFVSSLLGNHADYRLTLQGLDPEDSSVIVLDLMGPGPEAGCRQVVEAMRKDGRVALVKVEAQGSATPTASTPRPTRGLQLVGDVQPIGTVHAGVDGDWVVEPLNGLSYPQQARDRYECDISAVARSGFDPTKDDGGVPPEAVHVKRADYLRAEASCLQSRGYLMR
jgi:hypothetical protein